MRAHSIPIKDLSEDMLNAWRRIQASTFYLRGPCFSPELFTTVAKYYDDIHVAVLLDDQEIIGFLPFLKDSKRSLAKPVPMCDYQMIISSAHRQWDVEQRGCRPVGSSADGNRRFAFFSAHKRITAE